MKPSTILFVALGGCTLFACNTRDPVSTTRTTSADFVADPSSPAPTPAPIVDPTMPAGPASPRPTESPAIDPSVAPDYGPASTPPVNGGAAFRDGGALYDPTDLPNGASGAPTTSATMPEQATPGWTNGAGTTNGSTAGATVGTGATPGWTNGAGTTNGSTAGATVTP